MDWFRPAGPARPAAGRRAASRFVPELSVLEGRAVPTVQFAAAGFSVDEAAGVAVVTVTRSPGEAGRATVNYTAWAGTAGAGPDFVPASGAVTFEPGETARTFRVDVLADGLDEPDETVRLALTAPQGGGAVLGTPSTATLTVRDADPLRVSGFRVDDGTGQRSRVAGLRVTFNGAVAVGPANFPVAGFPGTVGVTATQANGRTVADLAFAGPGTEAGSLADGRYTLTVTGVPGLTTPVSYSFHRAFGDRDGTGGVDNADLFGFLQALNRPAGYSPAFDADQSGAVDNADLFQFLRRQGGDKSAGPVASFTATATSGQYPLTVTFTDTSAGQAVSREWDADGDGVVDGRDPTLTWTYHDPGEFEPRLTVAGLRRADTTTLAVTVTPPAGWAADGRAVLARETFAADRTPAAPGQLGTPLARHGVAYAPGQSTPVMTGVPGGRDRGPRVTPTDPAVSGAVPPAGGEVAAGYSRWWSRWDASHLGGTVPPAGEVGGWFWFGGTGDFFGARVFSVQEYLGNEIGYLHCAPSADPDKVAVTALIPYGQVSGTVLVPARGWVWLSLGWAWDGTGTQIRGHYRLPGQPAASPVGPAVRSPAAVASADFGYLAESNQPGWWGRVGLVQVAGVPNLDACLAPVGGTVDPADHQVRYRVDPVAGDDARPAGPWRTVAGAAKYLGDGTVLGATVPWRRADGAAAGYRDLLSVADKKNWAEAVAAGTVRPQGDVIEFAPGEYRTQVGLSLASHPGVSVAGDRAVLLADRVLATTWARPDPARYPHVWRAPNPLRGALLYQGAGRARALMSPGVERATARAAALTRLEATPGSAWSIDPDWIYVHAPGGADPNTLAWEHSGPGGVGVAAGSNLVRGLTVVGQTLQEVAEPSRPLAAYHYAVALPPGAAGPAFAFVGCKSEDYGKHAFAVVGTGDQGVGLFAGCDASYGPPDELTWPGGWTSFVDFSDGIGGTGTAGAVTYYVGCTLAVPVRAAGGVRAGRTSGRAIAYYAHNTGAGKQFAMTYFRGNSTPAGVGVGFPAAVGPVPPSEAHVAMQVLPP